MPACSGGLKRRTKCPPKHRVPVRTSIPRPRAGAITGTELETLQKRFKGLQNGSDVRGIAMAGAVLAFALHIWEKSFLMSSSQNVTLDRWEVFFALLLGGAAASSARPFLNWDAGSTGEYQRAAYVLVS
eukprot:1150435-Pelagomonas_calceolata.AAC.1